MNSLQLKIFFDKIRPLVIVSILLTAQNFLYFAPQWFYGYTFPGDFEKTYHAIPHYLIEASKVGVSTDWIPFTGIGYPTFLNIQSGLFYLPFKIIALFNVDYTINLAISLQCLTILFGAFGCLIIGRSIGLSWQASCLSALCYQGFGGYVFNSMHPDIVRGFSFIPWLCAPIISEWNKTISPYLRLSLILMPFVVYLQWTGGYPGMTIASYLMLTLLTLIKCITSRRYLIPLIIFFAIFIGTLMSTCSILPALIFKSEIARSNISNVVHDYMNWRDFFALIYETPKLKGNEFFSHDPTMNSLYVGIVCICLLSVGYKSIIRKCGHAALIMLVFGILFASGLFHTFLAKYFPTLLLSRFPYSDYKSFIVIPIILGMGISFDNRSSWKLSNLIFILIFVCFGNSLVQSNLENDLSKYIYLTFILIACVGVIYCHRFFSNPWLLICLTIIMIVDWSRIHWFHYHLGLENGVNYFNSGTRFERPGTNYENNLISIRNRLQNPPARRPARIDIDEKSYCWKGYYSGDYCVRDWSGPMQFSNTKKIVSSTNLLDYAKAEWTPLFVDENCGQSINWRESIAHNFKPILYNTNNVIYNISIASGGYIITNEMNYPGWSIEVQCLDSGKTDKFTPFSVDGFRAFHMRPGNFLVNEKFVTPYKKTSYVVTAIGLFVYLPFLFLIFTFNKYFKS